MTAEVGSPLLPPSSPAYGNSGENFKKSAKHKVFERSICIFCRDDKLTLKCRDGEFQGIGMENSGLALSTLQFIYAVKCMTY